MNFGIAIVLLICIINIKAFSFNDLNENTELNNNSLKLSEPINLEVLNSSSDEFAPVFFDGNLYFNSDRNKYSQFFISSYIEKNIEKNIFNQPILLKSDINNNNQSQSYITFESKEKAYFSKFNNYNGKFYLNLYYSNFRKQNWDEGNLIQTLSMSNFVSHPSISTNKDYLIFVVNKNSIPNNQEEGKSIDTDLMVSYKDNEGNWTEPEYLDELNTNYSEITPFISGSNGHDTLYFASNGYGGPGGYDLYYSIKSNGKWQRPNPINELNTEYNESDICTFDNNIIFSSDRPGGKGNLDLYLAQITQKTSESKSQKVDLEITLNPYLSSIKVKRIYDYIEQPILRFVVIDKQNVEKSELSINEKSINELNKSNNCINFLNQNINISNSNFKFNNALFIGDLPYISFVYPLLELNNFNQLNIENDLVNIEKQEEEENLFLYLTIISKYDNLKLNTDNSIYINKYIEKLKTYLVNNKLLNPENIQLNYIYNNNINQDTALIYLDYSNYNFLSNKIKNENNLEIKFELIDNKDSVTIEPNMVGFEFQARPVSELKNWNTYLLLKEKEIVFSSNNAPIEFQVDLTKYKDEIKFKDSLTIYTNAINNSGKDYNDITNIIINQTKLKSKKLFNLNLNDKNNSNNSLNNTKAKFEKIDFYLPYFDDLLLKKDINLNTFLKNKELQNIELIVEFPTLNQLITKSYNKTIFISYLKNNFPKLRYKLIDKNIYNNENYENSILKECISFYFYN